MLLQAVPQSSSTNRAINRPSLAAWLIRASAEGLIELVVVLEACFGSATSPGMWPWWWLGCPLKESGIYGGYKGRLRLCLKQLRACSCAKAALMPFPEKGW